jgi:hypothetical protein
VKRTVDTTVDDSPVTGVPDSYEEHGTLFTSGDDSWAVSLAPNGSALNPFCPTVVILRKLCKHEQCAGFARCRIKPVIVKPGVVVQPETAP